MTTQAQIELGRWAIRWTEPNGRTGITHDFDDRDEALDNLRAAQEIEADRVASLESRIRYTLQDRLGNRPQPATPVTLTACPRP